jgi:predicted Zn-dependent protease
MVRALLRSYVGDAKDAVSYFDDAIAEHKYNNEVAAHYGLVASLLRGHDIPRARKELATLERMGVQHPMIEAMAGHVLLDGGDLPGAIKRFEGALARYPGKMQLVYDYPDALIQAGRFADAAAFTEQQIARFPNDGPLHLLAARAYAGLNKDLMQHRHQGEYYAWQGDLKGAVTQFELAAKAKDGDFYQASVVDTRLRALRREIADQDKKGFMQRGFTFEASGPHGSASLLDDRRSHAPRGVTEQD